MGVHGGGERGRVLVLAFCVAGIWSAYITQGVLRETLYADGRGFEAVAFCREHPEAAWDILIYCLCGAVGQNIIFLTISRFSSLTNMTITTTQKFVSIVVSSLLSSNPLAAKQWGSVVMVFAGLYYQIYLKWRKLQSLGKKMKKTT